MDDPAGVYIHVPFCRKRCPYCAFVLMESDGALHRRYVQALKRELEAHRPAKVRTLYFGGGTPSLLRSDELAELVEAVGKTEENEITLETNPEDADLSLFCLLRQIGVTRLTFGIQSFDEGELCFLGRRHTPSSARSAIEKARTAGFSNLCIDLIFGMAIQTRPSWRQSLETAVALRAEHISVYGLTIEPGTPFERQHETLKCTEELERDLFEIAIDMLTARGYRHYEISNFAKPGFESKHNLGYWEMRPYQGYGPGAHSYVPHRRGWNVSNVPEYLERVESGRSAEWKHEDLTREQRMAERILLSLRRDTGISIVEFEREFAVRFHERYARPLDLLQELRLVEIRNGSLGLSRKGIFVADEVVAKLTAED